MFCLDYESNFVKVVQLEVIVTQNTSITNTKTSRQTSIPLP